MGSGLQWVKGFPHKNLGARLTRGASVVRRGSVAEKPLMMVLAAVLVLATPAWDIWSIDHLVHRFGA